MTVTVTNTKASGGGSSKIKFVSPSSLRIDGTVSGDGDNFVLVANSGGTWVQTEGSWERETIGSPGGTSVVMGIAACTGISGSTAATVPGLLFQSGWGDPFLMPQIFDASAPQETIQGILTYHIHSVTTESFNVGTTSKVVDDFWIDTKTYMLVKSKTTIDAKVLNDTSYSRPIVNVSIPTSTFAKPAGAP